jgi:hypothetical protein
MQELLPACRICSNVTGIRSNAPAVSERKIISELKSFERDTRRLCDRMSAMLTMNLYSAPHAAWLWLDAELPAAAKIPQFLIIMEGLADVTNRAASRLVPRAPGDGRPKGSKDRGLDQFVLQLLLCVRSHGGLLTIYKTGAPSRLSIKRASVKQSSHKQADDNPKDIEKNVEWGGNLLDALMLLWPYLSSREFPSEYTINRIYSDFLNQFPLPKPLCNDLLGRTKRRRRGRK